MTVQSIDKRLAAEANMTPATQDKSQTAISAEDAFVALLAQTNQRFGARGGDQTSPDKVLAQHFARKQVESRTEKAQAARDDAQSDRAPAAKDPRPVAKADKGKPAPAASAPAKPVAKDDAPAAQASAADDAPKAAADDDAAVAADQNDGQTAQQDNGKAEAQQLGTNAVAVQEKVVVEIDITVEEMVQVVAVDANSAQTVQVANQAQVLDVAAEQAAASDVSPLANLSKEDRQRVTDLENRIMEDLESGDMDDALDAATELVSQLIDKAGQQQGEGVHGHKFGLGKSDLAKQQESELSDMLAGTGAQLNVSVQVNKAASDLPAAAVAAVAVNAQAQADLAAQGQQDAGQNLDQNGQRQTAQTAAEAAAQISLAPADVPAAAPVDDIRAFSAVLAAQVEANAQDVKAAAPETRPVGGLAGIGAAQAADKPTPNQAAQAPRAPRVPLQQQVMDQVSVQIDKAVKEGADTVKIQLKPLDLGRIEIKLEVVDGRVSATVTAEKPETLALLQKDAKGLEKALEDAGLKPDSSATSFNLKQGEQQQNADRGNNGARKGRGRHGLSDEAAAIAGTQAAQPRRSGGRSGVDISV